MDLQVSEFLQNRRTWQEEAKIFLSSVNIGESFRLYDKIAMGNMQQYVADNHPGEFASRMTDDGQRRFTRINKNKQD